MSEKMYARLTNRSLKPSALRAKYTPRTNLAICTLGISLQGAKYHRSTPISALILIENCTAIFFAVPPTITAETAATVLTVAKRERPSREKGYYGKTQLHTDDEAAKCQRTHFVYHKQIKQENLYATYRTADNAFWSNLARESQQEFKRSGTKGKCIEARELVIALPETFTQYEPQELLERFTDEFRKGMA